MNYLTNYYKSLSEQLQEKVNHLEQLLEKRKTEDVLVTGYKVTGGLRPNMEIHGVLTKGKGSKRGREVIAQADNIISGYKMLGDTSSEKIGTRETPTITVPSKDLTPDHHDSDDADLKADTSEVLRGKTEEQMRAALPQSKRSYTGKESDEWEHHPSYEGTRSFFRRNWE